MKNEGAKMNQMQIRKNMRVKLQTSPSTQLNFGDVEMMLRLGGGCQSDSPSESGGYHRQGFSEERESGSLYDLCPV